ncbi:LacI family DNA-binding transcriptional regulator [Mesorhizobium sp. YM1C-6-2]|uniref:LacI family DNA-binding transcriptional regulator n=1 Tax=Mesorhizobium sp. YM1C-6-2 TaxID=1827501 RepID=UPI000EF1A11D|nr:LacI family DNA-binding transcriptional regulator [Mesorhizobium sp. YM1C-6-2]RLP26989.1 LacI family transcriptional regulator [Mesorhizobium sp. YM1C-6-2]
MTYEVGLGSERLCTIKEIADRAALGAGTVHRALKGGRLVSIETRRLVLDTVRLLNEEKIARAARLEHAAEKVQTSTGRPRGR